MAEAFTWGGGGNKLTANDRRRRIAEAMIKAGTDYSPVQHWAQGLSRVAQALVGGWEMNQADKSDAAGIAALANEPALMPQGSTAAAPVASAPSMAGDGAARTMAMPAAFAEVAPRLKADLARDFGLNDVQAAAFAGNLAHESGGFNTLQEVKPTVPGSRGGFGYAQWTGPRRRQFETWTAENGLDPTSYEANYGFLKHELANTGEGKVLNALRQVNDPSAATQIVSDQFLRPGIPGMASRQKWTQRALTAGNQSDLPAPGASPVSQETGQPGFFVPPSSQPDSALPVMQPNGAFPNFDPATGRWLGPGTPQQAPNPGEPLPGGPPPAMSAQTFNQVASALDAQPLQPVFQSEGVGQPWMGTALPPQAPAPPQVASAPLPPPRPTDLAMPQADLPAPGAVQAMGQFPPAAAPAEDLSNAPGAGAREGIVQALMAQQGQTAPAAPVPVQQVAQALAGGQTGTVSAPAASPAVQNIAAALAPQAAASAAPSSDRVASAIRVMNSPYAQPGQKAVAQMILQQAYRDPAEAEAKKLDLELKRKSLAGDPLEREAKQLEIDTKKKALGETKPPPTLKVKQADGSEVTMEWDSKVGTYVPLRAPLGGAAVGPTPTNPFALPGKPTEGQSKDAGFAGRMVESHNQISGLESVGTDRKQAAAGAVPFFGNMLSSADKQKFEQAKRNFVTSVLRKESGAAISPTEFETEDKKYFPQVGDSPEVIKQKRDARELAIEGVFAGAGSGYKVPESYKPQRGKTALPTGQTKSGVKWSVE